MKDVSNRFTTWLAGFYEDFQSMRVISEGEDYASTDFFTNRRDSHAGNTMAAQALNNPRFTFDYLTRSFTSKNPPSLIGSAASSEAASLHNEGPSQWLTYDSNRIGAAFYEGRASLTYPDTIGDAASLRTFKVARRADFSRFASGWGTQNEYWVRQGDTDATYERSGFTVNSTHGYPYGTTSTRGYGKFDITSLQPADTSGVPQQRGSLGFDISNYRKHKVMHSSSLCGVYLGETGQVAVTSSGIGLPYAYLYPIKSPSGKPFFRHTMSRRVADWLTSRVYQNGSTNKYNFAGPHIITNFPDEGALGTDDQWFALSTTTEAVVATGLSFPSGATSITLPHTLPSPPSTTNILNPSNNRHLPNKSSGTPTQLLQIGIATYSYSGLSVSGSGDVTFSGLSPALPSTQIQPTVIFSKWTNQAAGDTSLNIYNITTAGTPDPTSIVFQNRQDTSDGLGRPQLNFRDNAGNVVQTSARTQNGSATQDTPKFTVSSNTAKGYTYYSVALTLENPSGFVTNPDYQFCRDPFFSSFGNVYGRLEVGDYLTRQDQSLPEKITVINNDGSYMTDGAWLGTSADAIVRQATYGSYTGNNGRPLDGMFGFQPVIVGDTELNAQTDGERFTIRLANQSFNNAQSASPAQVDASYMLSVGYCQTQTGFSLNERGNMAGSKAAITHLFRPVTGQGLATARSTLFKMFTEGTTGKTNYTLDQLWYDLDIVMDFSTQHYMVFHDGVAVGGLTSFNAKHDGSAWTAADFYGWSLGVQLQSIVDTADTTGWNNIVTMIDRAAYIYALDGRIDTEGAIPNSPSEDFIVDKFKITKQVDGISQMELNIIDDTDLLNLPQLYSGRPNWKVLLFRDNDYRPIHSAIVANVNWKQNAQKKTKELALKSKDSMGELDFQFPYFDVGQKDGAPSLVAAYRRYEVTNYANIFHFGATSLLNLNMVLGLDEDSKGSTGEYLPRYDQRMRLFSGHPIQMYSNEEVNGPNYVEDAWEVSRRVDHFMPDANDATKTRAVFTSDAIKWSEDQIPAGVKIAIKGNWRNAGSSVGGNSSIKSLPEFAEKGFLTSHSGATNPQTTPQNVYRGEWTSEQAQTVITFNAIPSATSLVVANTSLFPASGTVKVGGTGASAFGATQITYTSKNSTTLFLSGAIGQEVATGTVVRETTNTNYVIIDQAWQRSMVITDLRDDGTGKLQMTIATDPTSYAGISYELGGGTGYVNPDSALAKNDLMTPTLVPSNQQFRIYFKPNTAGISHNSNVGDLPSQVFETTSVSANGSSQATFVTTTNVASLSAGLRGALPLTLAASSGGLADGLEADLAYMTFPKQRQQAFSLRNVGSSYAHRDTHARWIRDIPQSLWFQKTFGIMSEYPYGATGWSGSAATNAATQDLTSNFNSGVDATIALADTSKFPFAGVCEIWSNDPSPRALNSSNAVMLTSFAYSGKTSTTLTNVMFADANKGIIPISGGAGTTRVIARNISGDYKHCFILWADMRNDGSADADGGRRKEDFGLIHPVQQNYKVSVVWAETGQSFVDLKLGQDCDIWSINAKNDPAATSLAGGSKKAWSDDPSAIMLDYASSPTLVGGRSDDTELLDYYKDWEDTAGAFIVVDLSKFFNVNTEANNGRLAQASGGNKPLGEYLVEGAGTPTLIDSYWYHAAATFQNAEEPILQHQNSYRWVNADTIITTDQVSSTTGTLSNLESTADFPARLGVTSFAGQSTAGLIESKTFDANGNESDIQYVFTYTGKNGTTELTGFKYREVRQTESIDVAAGLLWSNDAFTVVGVPAMQAEGTVIRASLGSSFPMGFMLKVEGKVKSPSGGNYFENDKVRIYQKSALYSDWFKQITLPAISDINNVPMFEDFNVSGNTVGAGTVESFGSVTEGQNKSIFQVMRTLGQSAGVGDGGSLITLNFQMGRDNRMEFRPTYNCGLSLTRNNLKVSNLKTSKAASFSHIRVLFNGGESSVTFPTLEYKTNVRFKYVNATDVSSYEQALVIAKQEYQKKKEPSFSVEAEVIREANETQRVGPMLENARYGYIADPAVQLTGRNGGYWTAGRGGMHFGGQNNPLHGGIGGYGQLSLLTYQFNTALGIGIGGYSGAANYTTTYGNGLAHYPTNDLYNQFPWTQMYYWYGSKSVSYAVQIVHIPKSMPTVSETTGEELRIFISDAVASIPAGDRVDNLTATKKFSIHIADYDFDEAQSGGHVPKLQATQHGIETITTLGSGYFEVPIPASYWAAGNAAGFKMVVSVNAEYLNAVARQKTADKFGGNAATGQTGVVAAGGQTLPTFSNANEFSIFPLGIREYPELGSSAVERASYYAPRIHVTDDMNFIPGTYAQYTDSFIDVNEIMYITKVEYEYSSKNLSKTKLHLERESGRMPEGIESYLASNPFNDTGASGGGTGGGGAGGNGGNTGGRENTPTGPVGDYIPPTTDNFPYGYTGGQQGTSAAETTPPLLGGIAADLGNVATPSLGGTNYLRLNTDTGIQQMGQSGDLGTREINSNNLNDGVIARINNKMSLDSVLPSGIQGIPGQPKPSKLPPKVRAIEGVDTKFVSARGQAAVTSGGWVLPGASQLDDAEAVTNPVHTLELSATTPMDAAHPVLGMNATVSCEVLADTTFSLTTTITCPDTGETISHTYTEALTAAANGISRKTIPLIPQQFFAAANVEGRNLNVVISRSPNQGSDNAIYSSVVVHGVQMQNVVHNNQGTPSSESLSAFAGTEKDTSDTTGHSINVNSNTNPL